MARIEAPPIQHSRVDVPDSGRAPTNEVQRQPGTAPVEPDAVVVEPRPQRLPIRAVMLTPMQAAFKPEASAAVTGTKATADVLATQPSPEMVSMVRAVIAGSVEPSPTGQPYLANDQGGVVVADGVDLATLTPGQAQLLLVSAGVETRLAGALSTTAGLRGDVAGRQLQRLGIGDEVITPGQREALTNGAIGMYHSLADTLAGDQSPSGLRSDPTTAAMITGYLMLDGNLPNDILGIGLGRAVTTEMGGDTLDSGIELVAHRTAKRPSRAKKRRASRGAARKTARARAAQRHQRVVADLDQLGGLGHLAYTYLQEVGPASGKPHWPTGNKSGVTIGPGLDLGGRTPAAAKRLLQQLGFSKVQVDILSQAAGKRGVDAKNWIKNDLPKLLAKHKLKKFPALSDTQQTKIFARLAPQYLTRAKKIIDRSYGKGTWDRLAPEQKAMLFDFNYNAGLGYLTKKPPRRFKLFRFVDAVVKGDRTKALTTYKRYKGRNDPLTGRNKSFKHRFLDKPWPESWRPKTGDTKKSAANKTQR